MFTKIALNQRLSRTTVGHIHRYLFDFGQGTHRVFWIGRRAYLETDCATDVALLRAQFPEVVEKEMRRGAHDLPFYSQSA